MAKEGRGGRGRCLLTSDFVHTTAMFRLLAAVSSHSWGTCREKTEKSEDCSDLSVTAREILATMRMLSQRRR